MLQTVHVAHNMHHAYFKKRKTRYICMYNYFYILNILRRNKILEIILLYDYLPCELVYLQVLNAIVE